VNAVDWSKLRSRVLVRVKPGAEEERRVKGFAQGLLGRVNGLLQEAGFDASAELHGSVAHGTWVSGEQDLDIFVVLSPKYGRGDLEKILDVLKAGLDGDYVEAYAEHPYLKARLDGYDVDFVPCFRVDPAVGIISSTDRTPHHTRFLAGVLDAALKDEVRLLKQWARGVGIYGAEIRVGGLSGYLCELLVLSHGSFAALMAAASSWRAGTVVQFGTALDEEELRGRFQEPLVVVDPVDPSRNVASAVTADTFWTMAAAARRFTEKPREEFFWGPAARPTGDDVLGLLDGSTDVAFLVVEESHAEVADTLWGQIHKSREALHGQLEAHDFRVLGSTAWSDEETRHVFAFRVESRELPPVAVRWGPPVGLARDSERFIKAHAASGDTVAGPGIQDGRWMVLARREHTDVTALLSGLLEDGGRGVGVSRNLSIRVLQHHRLLLNSEIGPYLEGGLVDHLYWFLKGRPFWLD
jgi:tRNA nucleotidyltransferase (CCA-adding enzyme)